MFTKHYQNQPKPSLLMRKSIFLLVCSLLAFSFIHAQNRTIHAASAITPAQPQYVWPISADELLYNSLAVDN